MAKDYGTTQLKEQRSRRGINIRVARAQDKIQSNSDRTSNKLAKSTQKQEKIIRNIFGRRARTI